MTSNDIALLGLLIVLKTTEKQKRKKREKWVKDWLLKRAQYSHTNLLCELTSEPKDFLNYLRMDESTYISLLSMVTPYIQKKDTVMRESISPHARLSATLRFLATGRSYEDLKFTTLISPQCLGKIIPETCQALYTVLHTEFLKFPNSTNEWKEIASQFQLKWNFPHCLGAIDGKHVWIVPPTGSGSDFYNYKGQHSMVLMAIVDANYRFLLVDVGTNGRISDGGVLYNTKFYEKLVRQELQIPEPETSTDLHFVFVADDAFSLREDTMKPFRQVDLISHERKIFNYRLSRARRVVENAFGIMASRFRIYHTQMNYKMKTIEKIVLATTALHNFLITKRHASYAPETCFYSENVDNGTIVREGYNFSNSALTNLERRNFGNLPTCAKNIREEFVKYFVNEGAVPWQNKFIS